MEGAVTSNVTRSTAPERIERDLAALWREVGRQGRIARAVMSNLIVFRPAAAAGESPPDDHARRDVLDAVAARHPCRLIVLEHQRDASGLQVPPAVQIRIATFGTETSRYGVEQIAIRAACADACLPSIVSALVRGGVPTSLWWMGDLSQIAPLDSLVRMSRQLVYDSREWQDVGRGLSAAVSLLGSGHRLDLADLNWRRLTALRQALVHACVSSRDRACLESLGRDRVRVVHRPGDGALAWLTVGWLASRLHWTHDVRPAVEEDANLGDAVLTIHVGDRSASLNAVLDDYHVAAKGTRSLAPVTTLVPRESHAAAVAAELRNLTHDVCLHDAVRSARLFVQ